MGVKHDRVIALLRQAESCLPDGLFAAGQPLPFDALRRAVRSVSKAVAVLAQEQSATQHAFLIAGLKQMGERRAEALVKAVPPCPECSLPPCFCGPCLHDHGEK